MATERARPDAAAWIFIRTQEAATSPDPRRTVVQVHDLFDEGLYRPGGRRAAVARCAALVLTHPAQRDILERNGVDLNGKQVLLRPIGALDAFRPRTEMAGPFRIGWVGRPVKHFGVELKRVTWLIEAATRLDLPCSAFEVVFIGERLEEARQQLVSAGISCKYYTRSDNPIETYPHRYRELDCLVATSRQEAGPNCLFEALASGIPVISTPVGWAEQLIHNGDNGFLVEDVCGIAKALRAIHDHRAAWFQRRWQISGTLKASTLESWIEDNLGLATRLVRG